MPPTRHSAPISGAKRVARVAVAAGLAAAISVPLALAADAVPPTTNPAGDSLKSAYEKLGLADARLLAEAKAKADHVKTVTMMIATAPGRTEQVARELDAVKGGSVGRTYDKLGYVRATVPTAKADSAIAAAAKLSSVQSIDLRQEIKLDDPLSGVGAAGTASAKATADTSPAPDKNTPAANPYNPSFETGAVDFVRKKPKADGRGVTIGVLDTGVDLASPALQKTTTGERKITDWVTSTDPIVDGDPTWRPMTTSVSGASFSYDGQNWKAPAGSYRISVFREGGTADSELEGDVNRDGDTTDDWGVLYDPAAGTVTVDTDDNGDFTDDTPMKPYKDGYQIGYFGTDNPSTDVVERIPFVVQIRKDVPMDPLGGDWVGKKSDFVNIGIVTDSHGTHVAGITSANGMFGGKMNGAAPGAKIVSSRACLAISECTNVAVTEGMIDLVVNRGVDIVNMSLGKVVALNDGSDATSELYTRLIDTYGVQLVNSAGNSGPGANTIGYPGLADKVISVGAGISKDTWAANYGAAVEKNYSVFAFSSRGPREDGGFTPTVVAPGSAVSTTPTWLPGGQLIKQAGWTLPPGYSVMGGTSMASPQTTGVGALLLSAAKEQGVDLTPAKLRTALTSTARHIKGLQAYEEGAGRIDVVAAWKAFQKGATAHDYTVKAPVDTALDQNLKTPGFGTGLYDREGGLKAGQKKTYDITITRTSGPDARVPHELRLKNNKSNTFSVLGPQVVALPLNKPVTVQVQAAPTSAGIKSARLEVDDPLTEGVDQQIMTTVVVSTPARYTYAAKGSVQRASANSYFVTVPEGAKSAEFTFGGLKDGSIARFSVVDPYGVPLYDDDPDTPDVASYTDPLPGVWEVDVQASQFSKPLDNPYDVGVTVFGVAFAPETVTVPEAKAGAPRSPYPGR